MNKVLIVDDNQLICMGIKCMVPWDNLSLQCAGCVDNVNDAIVIIKDEEPQIVITDIKMPGHDGIYLLKYINENHQAIQTIVISAYDDFQYARLAMKAGSLDYLLKPIRKAELVEALKQAVDRINKKTIITEDVQLEALYNMLKDKSVAIVALVANDLFSNDLEFDFKVKIDEKISLLANVEKMSFIFQPYSISFDNNITLERFGVELKRIAQFIRLSAFEFNNEIKQQIETKLSIENKVKNKRMFSIDSIKLGLYAGNSQNTIEYILYKLVGAQTSQLEKLKSNQQVLIACLKEISSISSNAFDSARSIIDNIEQQENTFYYKNLMIVFVQINELLEKIVSDENKDLSSNIVTSQIKRFIDNNYGCDLSLEILSSQFNYSQVYLSKIFKKEQGCNINKYINSVRMKKAYNMILETDMKIITISERVGFNDYIYFTKRFKKCYGIPPGLLRRESKTEKTTEKNKKGIERSWEL